jgi:membrane-associated phospholipid phosphatase
MAVVVMGHFVIALKSFLLLPLALLVIFAVGFSRVYSRSRFPHQIVGSWFLGVVGLIAGMFLYHKIDFPRYGYWILKAGSIISVEVILSL